MGDVNHQVSEVREGEGADAGCPDLRCDKMETRGGVPWVLVLGGHSS